MYVVDLSKVAELVSSCGRSLPAGDDWMVQCNRPPTVQLLVSRLRWDYDAAVVYKWGSADHPSIIRSSVVCTILYSMVFQSRSRTLLQAGSSVIVREITNEFMRRHVMWTQPRPHDVLFSLIVNKKRETEHINRHLFSTALLREDIGWCQLTRARYVACVNAECAEGWTLNDNEAAR